MGESFENVSFENFMDWVNSDVDIDFDMNAQDPQNWTWLADLIPGIVVSSAGGIAPFQAEGLLHGFPFYYRERHGWATLTVGEADGEAPYIDSIYSASMEVEEFSGINEFVPIMLKLVPQLEKSSFYYQFHAKELFWEDDNQQVDAYKVSDKLCQVGAWGHNAEEAYKNLREVSEYLLSKGWSAEIQERMWDDRQVQPNPINTDDRVFPTVKPDFRVNI